MRGYLQFSFWIPIALAKICFSRIVINCAKIPLDYWAPSLIYFASHFERNLIRKHEGNDNGSLCVMKILMHFIDVLGRLKQREMIQSKVRRRTGTGNAGSTNYVPT